MLNSNFPVFAQSKHKDEKTKGIGGAIIEKMIKKIKNSKYEKDEKSFSADTKIANDQFLFSMACILFLRINTEKENILAV